MLTGGYLYANVVERYVIILEFVNGIVNGVKIEFVNWYMLTGVSHG